MRRRLESSSLVKGVEERMGGVQLVGQGGERGQEEPGSSLRRTLKGWCLQTAICTWKEKRSIIRLD